MPAHGARRGNLIYHWKHGWIPLDHAAALSKAKGSHSGAAKIMDKHGISHDHKSGPTKAKRGDVVVVSSKTSSFTTGPGGGHKTSEQHHVGVVTSISREGQVKKASIVWGSGRTEQTIQPGRHTVHVVGGPDKIDVQGALAAAHSNAWPHAPQHKGKAFDSLDQVRAALAPHRKGSKVSAKPLDPNLVKDLRGGSADKHLVTDATGTHFTAERAALHDKIIGQIVGGHKSQANPSFVMLGGGPASGKTKAAEAAAHDFPGAVTINPDDIKAMLPEYKQHGPDKAAAMTHEESSYLAKQAMSAAIAQKSHIILDAVGDNSVKSVEGKVASAKAAGYATHARYVTVPTHVAQTRAVMRGQRSGRVVPPEVIAHAHAGVSDVFPKVMGQFDTASLHDNTTDWKPVVSVSRGTAPVIHDPAAYHAFLSKAKG